MRTLPGRAFIRFIFAGRKHIHLQTSNENYFLSSIRKVAQLAQLSNCWKWSSLYDLAGDGLHLAGDEAGQVLVLVHPGEGKCGDSSPRQSSQVTLRLYILRKCKQGGGQVIC